MYASQSKTGTLFIAFSTEKQPYVLNPIEAKDFDLDTRAVKSKLKILNKTPADVFIKKVLVVSPCLLPFLQGISSFFSAMLPGNFILK